LKGTFSDRQKKLCVCVQKVDNESEKQLQEGWTQWTVNMLIWRIERSFGLKLHCSQRLTALWNNSGYVQWMLIVQIAMLSIKQSSSVNKSSVCDLVNINTSDKLGN